ncbi:MAG: enoyl-CoA hydratase-related protein [Novosphingobium sp.]
MKSDLSLITVQRHEGFAIVALNRPERRNALVPELLAEFDRVMGELDDDPEIAVVVLTGNGTDFCVGLDVAVLKERGSEPFVPFNPAETISRWKGPVIAAINGFAVTGGFEITLACDIILAADDAIFIDTHSRVGLLPGWGLGVRLHQAIGIYRAKEIEFTGRRLPAVEAAEWGMVNRVVPAAQLLEVASDMARAIVAGAPGLPWEMKSIIDRCSHLPTGEALQLERSIRDERADRARTPLLFKHMGGSRAADGSGKDQ